MAEVRAFDHGDARIVSQLPIELSVANVDGGNVRGAALQQTVGEAAGRSTDVERMRAR